jgi:hypothetical protein
LHGGQESGHQRLRGEKQVRPIGAVDEPLESARDLVTFALDLIHFVQHPVVEETVEKVNADQPSVSDVPPPSAAADLPLLCIILVST